MATNTNLLDYSKQLAIKMRDPVDEGGADGKLFHAEHRYGYLTRGFGKLIRNLESIGYEVEYIYPEFYRAIDKYVKSTTEFQDTAPTTAVEMLLNGLEISLLSFLTNNAVFKPYKAVAKGLLSNARTSDRKPYRGRLIAINNAFESIHGIGNQNYDGEKNPDVFFFYVVDGKIRFISQNSLKIVSIHFLFRNPLPKFSNNSSKDLHIPTEFEDLFLSLAALEGSLDLGNQAKVNLYRSEINTELSLLAAGEKFKREKDKTDLVNG